MLSFEQVSEVQNLNLVSLEMFSQKIFQSTFYIAFPMSESVPKLRKWPIVFENYVFLEWAGFFYLFTLKYSVPFSFICFSSV